MVLYLLGVHTVWSYASYSAILYCLVQTLVDVNAWTEVAALFRRDSYAMHQLTGSSLLVACIQAGMSAMKSKYVGMQF